MFCNECQELLSDYIDGGLELGEQSKLEQHLGDCEPCRAVRDDLLQIVHFSQQLPLHTPSGTVWARIQADIAEQQPSGPWGHATAWWARMRDRHFNLSIPQLVASAAALVIVLSLGVMMSRRDVMMTTGSLANNLSPATATNIDRLSQADTDMKQLEQQINYLKETVEQRKASWNPELRQAFEKNLYYVDQSLIECRHQLSDNPGDDVSQELMLNAYREKVRLLEGFEKF